MLRHKTFSFINVFGLSISMSVCLLVITIIADQFSYDQHNTNKEKIFRVTTHTDRLNNHSDYASSPLALGAALHNGLTSVEKVGTLYRSFSGDADVNTKVLPISGYIANTALVQMMEFSLLHGNLETLLDAPYNIVLTEKTAENLFDSKDVVGKTINFGAKGSFTVTGVLQKTKNKSHIDGFDFLISAPTMESLEKQGHLRFTEATTNWLSYYTSYVYVQLKEGASEADVLPFMQQQSQFQYASEAHLSVQFDLQNLVAISPFKEELSNQVHFVMPIVVVYALSGLAMLIMLSACFNYTNLSIARALTRAKEIGIRKVSGAFRYQIFLQFITESTLVSLVALGGAFGFLQLLIPAFKGLDPHITEVISLSNGVNTSAAFLLFSLFIGIVAGLFPAVYMSKLNPASILKDLSKIKMFSKINLRKTLIVVQFTLSLLFIIVASMVHTQFQYALNYDLGFTKENVLNIELKENDFQQMQHVMGQYPEVKEVAGALYTLGIGRMWNEYMRHPKASDSTAVCFNTVTGNYLDVMDHELVAGSNFPEQASDSVERFIIINEYMVTSFGYGTPDEAIGQVVAVSEIGDLEIVGVLKDFNYDRLGNPIHEFAFRFGPSKSEVACINLQAENIQSTLANLEKSWKKIDPVHAFEYKFYDEQISEAYTGYLIMIKVLGFFAFLAITISCLGLLGMAVYSTESRLKEIGIRKVLGANPFGLVYLLSKGFMRLLLLAVLVAIPLAYFGMDLAFADQIHKAPLSLLDFVLGSLVMLGLGLVTISSQTLNAANSNPVEVLKTE